MWPRVRLGYVSKSLWDISKNYVLAIFAVEPAALQYTLHILIQSSTSSAQYNDRQGNTAQLELPALPDVPGAGPSRAVLDAF